MNPDVFITIVFVGIAVLIAIVALVSVLPQIRRDEARTRSGAPPRAPHG